jgi:hypothetical protein
MNTCFSKILLMVFALIFSNITGVDNLPGWISNQSDYVYGEGYILRDTKALLYREFPPLLAFLF